MPLKGFKCPPNTPTAGNLNDFSWCINKCPHQCMPTAVLHTTAQRETENEHQGDMLSPSALSGCPRNLKLSRTEDYFGEPPKLFWATRGALIHGFLECRDLADVTTEQRVYKMVAASEAWPTPWLISGRVDFYDHARKKLEDIKTMADKGLWVIFNKGCKPEHAWQLNIYRWLLNGGHLGTPDGPVIIWPVKEMQVHYTLMNRVISTGKIITDIVTQKAEPNFGKPYKYEKSRKVIGNTRRGVPQWEIIIDLPAVPRYSYQLVEQYLQKEGPPRLRGFADSLHIPEGVIGDPEREWQCDYCEVKQSCDKIEKAEAVVRALANDGFQNFLPR